MQQNCANSVALNCFSVNNWCLLTNLVETSGACEQWAGLTYFWSCPCLMHETWATAYNVPPEAPKGERRWWVVGDLPGRNLPQQTGSKASLQPVGLTKHNPERNTENTENPLRRASCAELKRPSEHHRFHILHQNLSDFLCCFSFSLHARRRPPLRHSESTVQVSQAAEPSSRPVAEHAPSLTTWTEKGRAASSGILAWIKSKFITKQKLVGYRKAQQQLISAGVVYWTTNTGSISTTACHVACKSRTRASPPLSVHFLQNIVVTDVGPVQSLENWMRFLLISATFLLPAWQEQRSMALMFFEKRHSLDVLAWAPGPGSPDKAMDRRNSSFRICSTSLNPSSPWKMEQ